MMSRKTKKQIIKSLVRFVLTLFSPVNPSLFRLYQNNIELTVFKWHDKIFTCVKSGRFKFNFIGGKMFKEFKEFVMRGNVVDMAVGIIIGAAFGTIVKSLVADILMPPIGLLLGGVDFSNLFFVIKEGTTAGPFLTVADAQKAGAVAIRYGVFISTLISFLIIAFAIFLLVRYINTLRRQEEAPPPEPTTKECPHCFSTISIKASRCAYCTTELKVQ
jgi:large conductance mechanosensitive channel